MPTAIKNAEILVAPARFERHWETQRLVERFASMEIGEEISKDDLATACDLPTHRIDARQGRAREIVKRAGVVIRLVDGVFIRLAQEDVAGYARDHLRRASNSARRTSEMIKYGITDWEKLDESARKEAFALQAQAAVVVIATTEKARQKLKASQECANDKLDFGRTIELLKG